jgi:Myb-like DNA-binding protein
VNNRGKLWTKAEDKRLLKLYREVSVYTRKRWLWHAIAAELGRSVCAVQTRHHALQVGIRLAESSKYE